MFYHMYLSSVCERRGWKKPEYETFEKSPEAGIFCRVKVNSLVYVTNVGYQKRDLAVEGAAKQAYMICRAFSANGGRMPPGHRADLSSCDEPIQGMPMPIGSGRRSNRSSASSYGSVSTDSTGTMASSLSSGNVSPTSSENLFEQQLPSRMTPPVPRATGRRYTSQVADPYVCPCKRGAVVAYGACVHCLRSKGWA